MLRTQGRLTLGLGYDALGRRAWQYQYDPAGQMLARSRPDGRSELERFAWDAAGNLLAQVQGKSAGRTQGNRLTLWQDIRLSYDAWGNLASNRSGNRQTQHFVFDDENRLLAVKTENTSGSTQTRFAYDALGRRFVWQGLRMVQELRDSGLSNYVYSPDSAYTPMARVDRYIGELQAAATTDEAIAKAQQSARVYHYHTDLVGAPLELTDEQGELVWAWDYTAWGKLKGGAGNSTQARAEQNLRYPGQYADESTGLHYNTFRHYDPELGRYISQDPIGLMSGENLYAYVPNPAGWMDPWGWCGQASTGGAADAKFAQKTYGPMFSAEGKFAGKSVDDVAAALRAGAMKPTEVPVNYIVRDGQTIILNTGSAQALEAASIPRSQWTGVNQTGDELFESLLDGQLRRNPGGPFDTVRRTGTP